MDRSPSANDAWIFASLAGRGRTSLAQLIARADVLQHAIPTAVEIRSALRALYARGLIGVRGRTIGLTRLGRAVHADGLGRRGGLFAVVDNMAKALRSPRFEHTTAQGPPDRPDLRFVNQAAMARAYADYASR